MTAATPPPPRDGEVCVRCGHAVSEHVMNDVCTGGGDGTDWCPCRPLAAAPSEPPTADSPIPGTETPWDPQRPVYDAEGFVVGHRRPAAPSPVDTTEPPAEAQQYRHGGHQPWCGPDCTAMHYPPVPAETQQDDELMPVSSAIMRALLTTEQPPNSWALAGELARAAFSARPSADTETLRARVVRELLESDALTGDSEGTPERYTVHADDVPYLVDVVLRAARDAR